MIRYFLMPILLNSILCKFTKFKFQFILLIMFAGILEKILSKYFEKFFYGINSSHIHVGLWDGKFTIESIGLQPNVFNNLNLPISLKYSFVQKLSINFAWREDKSNLVINIENLYAILTPKDKQDLNFTQTLLKNKEEMIKNVIADFISKQNESNKSENQQRTTTEKYLIKILDNIQLKIRHIHIRYQNIQQKYSFGITINQIILQTRDENGKKCFFSRQKSQQQYVNQCLEINKIGIYWNSNESNMLSRYDQTLEGFSQVTNRMYNLTMSDYFFQDLIPNQQKRYKNSDSDIRLDYIISINMYCKLKKYILIQNLQNAEYECEVNFNKIQSKISTKQYAEIIKLIHFFLWYQSEFKTRQQFIQIQNYKIKSGKQILMMINQKKKDNQLKNDALKKYVRSYFGWAFRTVRQRIIRNKFIVEICKQKITFENIISNRIVNPIINKIDVEKLKQWLLIALKLRSEFDKVKYILKVNKKREQFIERIRKDLQILILNDKIYQNKEDIKQKENTQIINQYIWFKLNVKISNGKFQISKENKFGLIFLFEDLIFGLSARQKSNFFIESSMKDFSIKMFNTSNNFSNKVQVDILKKNSTLQYPTNSKLLIIKFEKNPILKPYVFTQTYVQFQSIEISIFPSTLRKIYSIFDNQSEMVIKSNKDQTLKTDRQNYNQTTIKTYGFQKNLIMGKIHSPWVIIPFSKINDKNSQCWVIRLGDFEINTPIQNDIFYHIKNIKSQQIYYEIYKLTLKNFELKYFSSISYFYIWLKVKDEKKFKTLMNFCFSEKGKSVDVIKPFSSQLNLRFLKKYLSKISKQQKYSLGAQLIIKTIQIKINSEILKKINVLIDEFNKQNFEEFIQYKKTDIVLNCHIKGYARVNHSNFANIKLYIVVTGPYMYFFLSEDSDQFQFYVNINQIRIILFNSMSIEKPTVFHSQIKQKLELYFNNSGQYQRWRIMLNRFIIDEENIQMKHEKKLQSEVQFRKKQKQIQNENKMILVTEDGAIKKESKYTVSFKIEKLQVILSQQNEQKFLDCLLLNFQLSIQQMIKKTINIMIEEFFVQDPKHPIKLFLSSQNFKYNLNKLGKKKSTHKKFLHIKVSYDKFKKNITNIKFNFKELYVAWKVDLIQKTIAFIFGKNINQPKTQPASNQESIGKQSQNSKKTKIEIESSMQIFNFMCVHKEYLVGIVKLLNTNIIYISNIKQQIYKFHTTSIEVFRYENNNFEVEHPILIPRKNEQLNYYIEYRSGKQIQHNDSIKKSLFAPPEFQMYPELIINIKGYHIYYFHEITLRMFDYLLDHFLGSITSKFKLKSSDKQIYDSLKIPKYTIMNIQLQNALITLLQQGNDESFLLKIQKVQVQKNLSNNSEYQPTLYSADSKSGTIYFNLEYLLINLINADLFYCNESKFVQTQINIKNKLEFNLQFIKMNLNVEFYSILESLDDIDRNVVLNIFSKYPLNFRLEKSAFLLFLKFFYRNIKHKDGLANQFENVPPYKNPQIYNVILEQFNIQLCQFYNQSFNVFTSINLKNLKAVAKFENGQLDNNVNIQELSIIHSSNNSKICVKLDQKNEIRPIFGLNMKTEGDNIQFNIKLQNYELNANLNFLDNIIDFFDFQAEEVEQLNEKKELKYPKKSFANFKIILANTQLYFDVDYHRLTIQGIFYINFIKNGFNQHDIILKQFKQYTILNKQISEKEIKVNGEHISITLDDQKISEIPNLIYNRKDLTCKKILKKYQKEEILVQQFQIAVPPGLLKLFAKIYQTNIKTNKNLAKAYRQQPQIIDIFQLTREIELTTEPIGLIFLEGMNEYYYPILKIFLNVNNLSIIMHNNRMNMVTNMDLQLMKLNDNLQDCGLLKIENLLLNYKEPNQKKRIINLDNIHTIIKAQNISQKLIQKIKYVIDPPKLFKTLSYNIPIGINNQTEYVINFEIKQNKEYIIKQNIKQFHSIIINLNHLLFNKLYHDQALIRIYISSQNIDQYVALKEIKSNFIRLDENLFLSLTNQSQIFYFTIKNKFKITNSGDTTFLYTLKTPKQTLTGKILQHSYSIVDFKEGYELYVQEEPYKEKIKVQSCSTIMSTKNYNLFYNCKNELAYLDIRSKIQLLNLLPFRIKIYNANINLQIDKYRTCQVQQYCFKQKKQIVIEFKLKTFKCETKLFFTDKPLVLQLQNTRFKDKYFIDFMTEVRDNTIYWSLKPQLILFNFNSASVYIKKVEHIVNNNTNNTINNTNSLIQIKSENQVIWNVQDLFQLEGQVLSFQDLKKKNSIKIGQYVLQLHLLKKNNTTIQSILIYSHFVFFNKTNYIISLSNQVMIKQGCHKQITLKDNEKVIIIHIIEIIQNGSKKISSTKSIPKWNNTKNNKTVYFFFEKNQTQRIYAKIQYLYVNDRRIIVLTQACAHYKIKNQLKDIVVIVNQKYQSYNNIFKILPNTEESFSLENPNEQEKFQLEFYQIYANISFSKKYDYIPIQQQVDSTLIISESDYKHQLLLQFKKTEEQVTLKIKHVENKKQIFEQYQVTLKKFNLELEILLKNTVAIKINDLILLYSNQNQINRCNFAINNLRIEYNKNIVFKKINQENRFLQIEMAQMSTVHRNLLMKGKIFLNNIYVNLKQEFLVNLLRICLNLNILTPQKQIEKINELLLMYLENKQGKIKQEIIKCYNQNQKNSQQRSIVKQLIVKDFKMSYLKFSVSYTKNQKGISSEDIKKHKYFKYLSLIPNFKEMKLIINPLDINNKSFNTQEGQLFETYLTNHIKQSTTSNLTSSINSTLLFESPFEVFDFIISIISGNFD